MRELVAIYCRLSDEERGKRNKADDSESIQNQKTMLINHALKNGWEIYDIYSDDDYSGADEAIQRPEFSRLMADAEKGRFQIVLAKSQSRFTRDMEYVEQILHKKFQLWGIRFVSLLDSADTAVPGNKKSRQINGLVNEWYVEDLSENIRAVFDVKKGQGKFVGAFAPYGYKKDPADKNHFIVDEPAADIVRLIFRLYLNGYGLAKVAQELNRRGYPSPAEYKRQQGLNYIPRQRGVQGRLWRSSSVNTILKNQAYVGDMVQGKSGTISYKNSKKKRKDPAEWVIVKNTHEAVISRETFELAKREAGKRFRPELGGKRHIFAGKLRCAACGCALVKHHGYGNERYFICPMKKFDICTGVSAKYQIVYDAVFGQFQQFTAQYINEETLDALIEEENSLIQRRTEISGHLADTEQRLRDAELAFENLYMDKVKGVLSEEQFLLLSRSLNESQAMHKKKLLTLRQELDSLCTQMDPGVEKKRAIRKYVDVKELTREAVDEFVDEILVKNTDKKNQKAVTIKWKF